MFVIFPSGLHFSRSFHASNISVIMAQYLDVYFRLKIMMALSVLVKGLGHDARGMGSNPEKEGIKK